MCEALSPSDSDRREATHPSSCTTLCISVKTFQLVYRAAAAAVAQLCHSGNITDKLIRRRILSCSLYRGNTHTHRHTPTQIFPLQCTVTEGLVRLKKNKWWTCACHAASKLHLTALCVDTWSYKVAVNGRQSEPSTMHCGSHALNGALSPQFLRCGDLTRAAVKAPHDSASEPRRSGGCRLSRAALRAAEDLSESSAALSPPEPLQSFDSTLFPLPAHTVTVSPGPANTLTAQIDK